MGEGTSAAAAGPDSPEGQGGDDDDAEVPVQLQADYVLACRCDHAHAPGLVPLQDPKKQCEGAMLAWILACCQWQPLTLEKITAEAVLAARESSCCCRAAVAPGCVMLSLGGSASLIFNGCSVGTRGCHAAAELLEHDAQPAASHLSTCSVSCAASEHRHLWSPRACVVTCVQHILVRGVGGSVR